MRPTFFRSRMAVAVLVAAAGVLMSWEIGGGALAQSSAPADSAARARQVAKRWADELVTKLRGSTRRDEAGRRLALQPLHPYHFRELTAPQRRGVYEWLLQGLGEVVRDSYSVLDPARLADISRVLEQGGAKDWFKQYEAILAEAKARINVTCTGKVGAFHIHLHCSAVDMRDGVSMGGASTSFELEWLNEPVALGPAVESIAEEILRGLKPGGMGKVKLIEAGGEESLLSKYIGGMLQDAMHRRMRSVQRLRAVREDREEAEYRLDGEIQILDERKLLLRVAVHLEAERLYSARRHIALKSIPKRLLAPGAIAGSATKDTGTSKRRAGEPATKITLHEAIKAGNRTRVEVLLKGGADVNGQDGRDWTGLMHAASRGYPTMVELLLDAGADAGLRAVDGATALYMAAGSGHLEIVSMLLEAGAETQVMGPRGRRAADAAEEGGYTKIVELLKGAEAERALRAEAARDDEAYGRARGLDTPAGYRQYEKERPGGRHRAAVRDRLRELDEAAYGKARGLDTVEGWAEYRRAFPEGLHGKEAWEREWELRERALELKRSELVLIQRGLVSLGKRVGGVDGVFGERTRRVIGEWQGEKGLAVTGYLTGDQARALKAMGEAAERERKSREEAERRARLERERREREAAERERVRLAREAAERERRAQEAAERRAREAEARRQAELAREEREPRREFRDCAECPEMVVVPAGEFIMGSLEEVEVAPHEGPRHRVRIGEVFAVGKYEVTFEEWDACVAGGGCRGHRPDDQGWGRGRRPAINVSWEDAKAYVRWLREKTGKMYRLLSEAEWEYVARAGTETRYTWGDEVEDNLANCYGCGSRWDGKTAPVGSFEANGFGLHDVHGNVWEWVEDCSHDDYAGAPTDGSAWTSGGRCGNRMLRGGSWGEQRYLSSARRFDYEAGTRSPYFGYRVARTLAR